MATQDFNKKDVETWLEHAPDEIIRLLAHDVNNMVQLVQGWAEILQSDANRSGGDYSPQLVEQALDSMTKHSERIAMLMDNAHTYADIVYGDPEAIRE